MGVFYYVEGLEKFKESFGELIIKELLTGGGTTVWQTDASRGAISCGGGGGGKGLFGKWVKDFEKLGRKNGTGEFVGIY